MKTLDPWVVEYNLAIAVLDIYINDRNSIIDSLPSIVASLYVILKYLTRTYGNSRGGCYRLEIDNKNNNICYTNLYKNSPIINSDIKYIDICLLKLNKLDIVTRIKQEMIFDNPKLCDDKNFIIAECSLFNGYYLMTAIDIISSFSPIFADALQKIESEYVIHAEQVLINSDIGKTEKTESEKKKI